MSQADTTRERILDTAERLFSEHSISDTSLRAITTASKVNLAAVHYHFGSKAELARAVVARRLEPLNDERMKRLQDVLKQEDGNVEGIVRAFVEPALNTAIEHPAGPRFARMLARALVDPHKDIRAVVFDAFRETGPAFRAALGRALPELSDDELNWRTQFMVGSLAHTVTRCSSDDDLPIPVKREDAATLSARLTRFLTAGLTVEEVRR